MNKRWWESETGFIRNRWWLILAILVLLITVFFTQCLWLPPKVVSSVAATVKLPTLPIPGTPTPAFSNTSVQPSLAPDMHTLVPTQTSGTRALHWAGVNDQDLMVSDPQRLGHRLPIEAVGEREMLDMNANPACAKPTTQPAEYIFWPTKKAPRENHQISVVYFIIYDPNVDKAFTVVVKVDGVTQAFDGVAKVEEAVIPPDSLAYVVVA